MKLKPGDKVTCGFIREESHVVRRIRAVQREGGVELASADGGDVCPTCNTTIARPIGLIVASWYTKVKE